MRRQIFQSLPKVHGFLIWVHSRAHFSLHLLSSWNINICLRSFFELFFIFKILHQFSCACLCVPECVSGRTWHTQRQSYFLNSLSRGAKFSNGSHVFAVMAFQMISYRHASDLLRFTLAIPDCFSLYCSIKRSAYCFSGLIKRCLMTC